VGEAVDIGLVKAFELRAIFIQGAGWIGHDFLHGQLELHQIERRRQDVGGQVLGVGDQLELTAPTRTCSMATYEIAPEARVAAMSSPPNQRVPCSIRMAMKTPYVRSQTGGSGDLAKTC